MSDRLDRLRATLHELECELADLDTADSETRGVLEQAAREIHAALHKGDDALAEHPTLVRSLTESAEEFEVSHPNLAGILRRVIDALGQLGI